MFYIIFSILCFCQNIEYFVCFLQVVAPTVSSPACAEQLVEAAKLVAKSVEGVVLTAQGACSDDKVLSELGGAATAVTRALNDLLQHVKQGATMVGICIAPP
jgi:talin